MPRRVRSIDEDACIVRRGTLESQLQLWSFSQHLADGTCLARASGLSIGSPLPLTNLWTTNLAPGQTIVASAAPNFFQKVWQTGLVLLEKTLCSTRSQVWLGCLINQ